MTIPVGIAHHSQKAPAANVERSLISSSIKTLTIPRALRCLSPSPENTLLGTSVKSDKGVLHEEDFAFVDRERGITTA